MTVSNTTTGLINYTGNGATTAFAVPFAFRTSADLLVYKTTISTGVEVLQTITTHYTVTGGGGTGSPTTGTVTMLAAPTADERITILRSVGVTQSVDLTESGKIPAETLEGAYDKLTLILQDNAERLTRAILFTPGSNLSSISIGSPVANWLLGWNSDADTIISIDGDTVAAPISLSSTGLVACTSLSSPRTYSGRTLTGPAAGLSISNGNGVSGNPTIALANDLAAVEALSGTGFPVRTASDTWTTRSITGTSDQITVTNGDGVSGAPTLSIPSTFTSPGSVTATTNVITGNQGEVRFNDSDSSNYVGFRAPGTVASNKIWTLPSADGSANQALVTDGTGTLSWANAGSGANYNIEQIVVSNLTAATTSSPAAGVWTDTGLSVTITPTSASSSIYLGGIYSLANASNAEFGYRIVKGSSTLASNNIDVVSEQRYPCPYYIGTGTQNSISANPMMINDIDTTVGTTSSVTYKLQFLNIASGSIYENRGTSDSDSTFTGRTHSQLFALEIS